MSEENSEWMVVGKVRDAHGLKGELFVVTFSQDISWMKGLEEFRLVRRETSEKGELVEVPHSFTIKRFKPHKVGFIVKVEELQTRTQAEAFRGARLHIPKALLTSQPGESLFLHEVEGFSVLSDMGKEIGRIMGFSSNGAQDLLVVKNERGESFEIPFIPEFVSQIKWDEKTIVMNLPEGLIGESDS